MPFAEALPPQCPPTDAVDIAHETIYRLLPTDAPTAEHFKSHAALGKPIQRHDPCRWASCSLLRDPVKWLESWPRLRKFNGFAARLSIPQGCGMSKAAKDANHVDFWRYAGFDCVAAIVEIIQLPEAPADG